MFSFNSDKYDFWSVYEAIQKYYPIGVDKSLGKLYSSYKGQQDFSDLIRDNIQNADNFRKRWKFFDSIVEKETGLKTFGTTILSPCFSSFVETERIIYEGCKRMKRIHYFASLLGKFFTLIGDDVTEISVGPNKISTTNYLVTSPFNEFADKFEVITKLIETNFNGYKFLPFFMLTDRLLGLNIPDSDESSNTIFSALFKNSFDLNVFHFGDRHFKIEDWLKEGQNSSSGYTAYPPHWKNQNP